MHSYHMPHSPYKAAPNFMNRFPHIAHPIRKVMAAMVATCDDSFNRIMNKFRTKGMTDNLLVVFSSDNGGVVRPFGADGEPPVHGGNNFPLRGMKTSG